MQAVIEAVTKESLMYAVTKFKETHRVGNINYDRMLKSPHGTSQYEVFRAIIQHQGKRAVIEEKR